MIERTLVIIKPDAVYKFWSDAITQRYTNVPLKVVHWRSMKLNRRQAAQFYVEHIDKFFFAGLVLMMSSGSIHAMVLEGEDAIKKVRELNGATDPAKAVTGTIRHDFRSAGGPFNTVHGSDSAEAAEREIKLLFG